MERNQIKLIAFIVGFIIVVIVAINLFPFVIVGAGERGVVFNNFSGVENRVLGEGTFFRIPFVESVHTISIKVQKDDVKAEASSKDLQDVSADVVINWHLNAGEVQKVYQNIGDNQAVIDNIIKPAVNEVVKAATAKKTAEEIIALRTELKTEIDETLATRLKQYFIVVDDISLVNISFSKEFNAAIEAKQIAEQQAKQAQFVADKAVKDAEAAVNNAKGEAESQKLQQQTITKELLQKWWIEKWSGNVPQFITGSGTDNFLFQIPSK